MSKSIDLCFLAIDRSLFSFVFDFVDIPYSAVKLICYLCDSVVPQLLILYLYPDWPKGESEVLQEDVQHVEAAGHIVEVYEEVFVEVYAHAIWIFVVFWSDLVAQLKVRFRLRMMDSQLWDPHLDLLQALG